MPSACTPAPPHESAPCPRPSPSRSLALLDPPHQGRERVGRDRVGAAVAVPHARRHEEPGEPFGPRLAAHGVHDLLVVADRALGADQFVRGTVPEDQPSARGAKAVRSASFVPTTSPARTGPGPAVWTPTSPTWNCGSPPAARASPGCIANCSTRTPPSSTRWSAPSSPPCVRRRRRRRLRRQCGG